MSPAIALPAPVSPRRESESRSDMPRPCEGRPPITDLWIAELNGRVILYDHDRQMIEDVADCLPLSPAERAAVTFRVVWRKES